jgi:hypothetical protein
MDFVNAINVCWNCVYTSFNLHVCALNHECVFPGFCVSVLESFFLPGKDKIKFVQSCLLCLCSFASVFPADFAQNLLRIMPFPSILRSFGGCPFFFPFHQVSVIFVHQVSVIFVHQVSVISEGFGFLSCETVF